MNTTNSNYSARANPSLSNITTSDINDHNCSPIKANPDIAGPGIIYSVLIIGAFTLVNNFVAYWFSGLLDRALELGKVMMFRCHKIVFETNKVTLRFADVPSEVLETTLKALEKYPLYRSLNPKKPTHFSFEQYCSFVLAMADLNSFTGIGLLLAAVVQCSKHQIDIYHMWLLHLVVWLPSQAHQSLLLPLFMEGVIPRELGLPRILIIMMYLILFIVFEVFLYQEFLIVENDDCLNWRYVTSKEWILVQIVLTIWGYLFYIEYIVRRYVFGQSTREEGNLQPETTEPEPGQESSKYVIIRLVIVFIQRIVFGTLVNALAMVAWYFHNIYELQRFLKGYQNEGSVKDANEEKKWGFGQVAAIMVVLNIPWELWKAYYDEKSKIKRPES